MGVVLETTRDKDITLPTMPVEVPFSLTDLGEELCLEEGLEILVRWASSVVGSEDAIRACEDFAVLTGKVFHDDTFYDSRMNYFLDHYLFERKIEGTTPYERLLSEMETAALPERVQEQILGLSGFRHGLFLIIKAANERLVIRNLVTKERLQVLAQPDESFTGFGKKDIFQGFLYPWRGHLRLSRGLILHPLRATKIIRGQLKKALKSQDFSVDSHLSILARKQLRYLRHRHVDSRLIYQHDPR